MSDAGAFEPANSSEELVGQARSLLAGQRDRVANAANLSALLFHSLGDVNWVGFYFLKDDCLLIGPFQGKPACVTIPLGKGVCGTAVASGEVQRVADVHAYDGHITCDAASRSELVLPLSKNGEVIGVLDLDSPSTNRFSSRDEALLLQIAEVYVQSID